MFQRIKPILFLVLTLLLGFLLGVISSRYLVEQKIKSYRNQERGKGFIRLHHDILQLTPEQQEAVDPVLTKYFEKLTAHRKAFRGIMDSMHTELVPLLTEEQKTRVEEIRKRTKQGGRRGGRPPFLPF
ncbi:MAG: hypothetical protein AAF694_20720 [Bacteroidota bacterium]